MGTDGGLSMKASDYSCIPLCADCHTRTSEAYHCIGKGGFERAHGLCFAALVDAIAGGVARAARVK
jgi:hypothetical protein